MLVLVLVLKPVSEPVLVCVVVNATVQEYA